MFGNITSHIKVAFIITIRLVVKDIFWLDILFEKQKPLKNDKNVFHFTRKAPFILKILKFFYPVFADLACSEIACKES